MHGSSRLSAPGSTPPRPWCAAALSAGRQPAYSTVPATGAHMWSPSAETGRGTLIRQGPLAGRYPAVAAMVMFALIPYLALSARARPTDADHRQAAPHEPADHEP